MGKPIENDEKDKRLEGQLEYLLQGSLGLNIYPRLSDLARIPRLTFLSRWAREADSAGKPSRLALSDNALLAGIQLAALYFLFFGILPWFIFRRSGDISPAFWPLMVLQLYGALWAGWATTSTRIANRSVMAVIKDIIPELSPEARKDVSDEIHRRSTPWWRLLVVSWGLGAVAAAIAGYLVYHDLPARLRPSQWEIGWWCLGWTLLYTTSAKVVNVSRFYQIFAESFEEKQALLWLNPAASFVVASTALVAKRMLLFWLAIAISIALILPFGLLVVELIRPENTLDSGLADLGPAQVQDLRFVVWHLVGTAFFSIGVGSLVFLRSEAALRRAARYASAAALRIIEKEVGNLQPARQLSELDLKRFAALRSLHADISEGGSYRTFVLSGLSLIIPFVPLLTLLLKGWIEGG